MVSIFGYIWHTYIEQTIQKMNMSERRTRDRTRQFKDELLLAVEIFSMPRKPFIENFLKDLHSKGKLPEEEVIRLRRLGCRI